MWLRALQVRQHCSLNFSVLHILGLILIKPQNFDVSSQFDVSLPSLEAETMILGSCSNAVSWMFNGHSSLQGGPKHVMFVAGISSSPHSWSGAGPPWSHSHQIDRAWLPPPHVTEHWRKMINMINIISGWLLIGGGCLGVGVNGYYKLHNTLIGQKIQLSSSRQTRATELYLLSLLGARVVWN